ncbi:hypothetical protein IYQ_19243 [Aeromonas salmonicida subsp. salmonicida 01-B526]|uniref:Uncharacterized protein n=1 Tax=Aeromonas salmonicida subsp. salmonicida 01-B526 TaxID=1076135 RepID=A0ABP2MW32_AERSS|nr:hypothetical protein IYQ_19243 [Aeromonas salmonicida subsp. salmonicida 01-B526]
MAVLTDRQATLLVSSSCAEGVVANMVWLRPWRLA